MTSKVKVEISATRRALRRPSASSGERGRPLSEILERVEARNPELAAESGLSSAAMRAGDMIRRMRKARGLTQRELAAEIGVSQERISEIETGVGPHGPTFALLERIARACGMRLELLPSGARLSFDTKEDIERALLSYPYASAAHERRGE